MHDLWQSVVVTTGRHCLGLEVAAHVQVDHFATFGRVIATIATMGDATTRGVRLFRLISETHRFSAILDGDRAKLVLETLHSGKVHSEAVEYLLGAPVAIARRLTGGAGAPQEVRFKHEAPPNPAYAVEYFGCPVRYGSIENALVFDTSALLVPVKGYDPSLCADLQREAEALLADRSEPDVFRRDVAAAISQEIGDGHATIERVAARLGMHPKALGRSLHAQGTSYRELLDEVRLHLARRYLEKRELGVTEIAYRLGYSEKSAFNRAFKRWTGEPPDRYRTTHPAGQ
jgi:AraC-like DNA-binding protein